MDVVLNDSALLAVLSLFCRKLKNMRVFCHGIMFISDFVRSVLFRSLNDTHRQYGDTKSPCFLPYVRRAG